MTENSLPDRFTSSSLVRQLQLLTGAKVQAPPPGLDTRLGELIDLSDSVQLANAQMPPLSGTYEASAVAGTNARADFLEVRATLLKGLEKSFNPGSGYVRIKLPRPGHVAAGQEGEAFAPYQRFYAAHQREIDFRVQGLRQRVRDVLTQSTPDLKQLARLDETMAELTSSYSRKGFNRVSDLLFTRYADLQDPDLLDGDDSPHHRFCLELKNLLLAEIEARLDPVLGLLEALDEHLDNTDNE